MILISVAAQSQQNPLWAWQPLGFGKASIGSQGCAITSLSMLLNATLEANRDSPTTINTSLRKHRAFAGPWGNYLVWQAIPSIWPHLSYTGRIDCPDRPVTLPELAEIDRRLEDATPVIVYVDASPQSGLQQHFVLIVGKDDDGEYIINNPWNGNQHQLCPPYGQRPDLAICGIILYERVKR